MRTALLVVLMSCTSAPAAPHQQTTNPREVVHFSVSGPGMCLEQEVVLSAPQDQVEVLAHEAQRYWDIAGFMLGPNEVYTRGGSCTMATNYGICDLPRSAVAFNTHAVGVTVASAYKRGYALNAEAAEELMAVCLEKRGRWHR